MYETKKSPVSPFYIENVMSSKGVLVHVFYLSKTVHFMLLRGRSTSRFLLYGTYSIGYVAT